MALRAALGAPSGELMREDAMPCSRFMTSFAGLAAFGGGLASWPFCYFYYGPRATVPRMARWTAVGSLGCAAAMAAYIRLWEPSCEPQNIEAYDSPPGPK